MDREHGGRLREPVLTSVVARRQAVRAWSTRITSHMSRAYSARWRCTSSILQPLGSRVQPGHGIDCGLKSVCVGLATETLLL